MISSNSFLFHDRSRDFYKNCKNNTSKSTFSSSVSFKGAPADITTVCNRAAQKLGNHPEVIRKNFPDALKFCVDFSNNLLGKKQIGDVESINSLFVKSFKNNSKLATMFGALSKQDANITFFSYNLDKVDLFKKYSEKNPNIELKPEQAMNFLSASFDNSERKRAILSPIEQFLQGLSEKNILAPVESELTDTFNIINKSVQMSNLEPSSKKIVNAFDDDLNITFSTYNNSKIDDSIKKELDQYKAKGLDLPKTFMLDDFSGFWGARGHETYAYFQNKNSHSLGSTITFNPFLSKLEECTLDKKDYNYLMLSTLRHELTHFWHYKNVGDQILDFSQLLSKEEQKAYLDFKAKKIKEGMSPDNFVNLNDIYAILRKNINESSNKHLNFAFGQFRKIEGAYVNTLCSTQSKSMIEYGFTNPDEFVAVLGQSNIQSEKLPKSLQKALYNFGMDKLPPVSESLNLLQ